MYDQSVRPVSGSPFGSREGRSPGLEELQRCAAEQTCGTTQRSVVQEALDGLDNQISAVMDACDALKRRLAPVLAPEQQKPVDIGKSQCVEARPSVRVHIEQMRSRLVYQQSVIEEVLGRLEV